ncbi:hypothetical protein K457DRAFT_22681 [Linnemannia elongata AG-77]|uniref:Uncharacterized protein n=1 Tax=Linnemannia elongata AG-77 TaxID=1314771 RepID=A0A197JNC7_9FUNG|nr:hypothetical protein K457DRAFT_22681 [Linnemannia elongata AG-77]
MEYVNPTTISFVAAGAGAGAYYVYANVIEPQNQAQRVLLAEQAQKELLMKLDEEEALRRGSSKQTAKRKPIVFARPKKIEYDNSDVTPEELNDKISTSNPFDLLERTHTVANANGSAATKSKKGAGFKKKAEVFITAPVAPKEQQQLPKAVSFDPKPEIKELPNVVLSRKVRKGAASKKQVASTPALSAVQLKVAIDTATAEAVSTKADAVKWPEAASPKEPEDLHAPEPFKPVHGHRNTFPVPAPSVSTVPEPFQTVKSAKSSKAHKQQQQQQPRQKPAVVEMVVEEPPKPGVSVISEKERTLAHQEFKALEALVQARDLVLAAAESRAERSMRKIQELQKQIESEAALVKSAQKTENKAQRLNEKVESLHYTNSILVRQLSVEKENLKTAQLQVIKKEAELAATAAAAAAETIVGNKGADAEWETKLEALEQERVQRAAQVENLQELNRELQQHRTQSESEISQLSLSLVEADRRAEGALRERNEIHHQLSMTVSDKEARIASLEADVGALEGELENSKVQVEQYAEAVGQAEEVSQSRHEIFEGEKHSLLEEIDLLRSLLAKEETKVVDRDAEVKKLKEELEAVREHARQLEGDHANALTAKHEEHQHVLSTNESALAIHITNLTTAQAEIETVRMQLKEARESHRGELEKLGQELEKSNTQIAILTESQQSWTKKMADLTEWSNESNSKALEQSATLNKRIQELEQEMVTKEFSHHTLFTEKEELVDKLSALETVHGSCHEQHGALTNEKQELHQTVSTMSLEVEQIRQEKETLATELAQKRTAYEELKSAKRGVDAELEALIEASDAKKTEIEQEYEALSLRVVELEHELEGLRQQQQTKVGDHVIDEVAQAAGKGAAEKATTTMEEEQQGQEVFNVQVEGLAVATH